MVKRYPKNNTRNNTRRLKESLETSSNQKFVDSVRQASNSIKGARLDTRDFITPEMVADVFDSFKEILTVVQNLGNDSYKYFGIDQGAYVEDVAEDLIGTLYYFKRESELGSNKDGKILPF